MIGRLRGLRPAVAALVALAVIVPVGVASTAAPAAAAPPPAVDPGVAGARPVEELAYDLGDEAFLPQGFGARVELRGKVYAPADGAEAAPLAILLHGRHGTCAVGEMGSGGWPCPPGTTEIPSYRGYDALGRNLASHGIVAVSIGANGINANDGFLDDGGADARAQLVMETLRRWKAWGTAATGSPFGSRFVGRIDTTRVALMGHSRGGEGVVAAANLNQSVGSPYGIRAVLALAPVDFARRVLGAVPLGVVLPDCDGDVSDLQGADYYDDGRYVAPEDPAARSVFHLRGANHNWFNTVWTAPAPGSFDDADWSGRYECRAGAPGRLSAPQQNAAGAALMSGYLRRYLLDDVGFQRLVTGTAPFPASVGPARWTTAHWAPDRLVVERWDSPATSRRTDDGVVVPAGGGSPGLVCNAAGADAFFGSRALTRVGCPAADWPRVVNDTGVFDLGWTSRGVVLRQPLAPTGVDVTAYDGLRFRAAPAYDSRDRVRAATLDLTVVLEDATGARASARVSSWSPALTGARYSHPGNVVLSGVRIPLVAFGGIDLTRIRAVELRADRTDAGRAYLADLAFTAEGVEDAAGPSLPAPTAVSTPACRRTAGARYACAVAQVVLGRDLREEELAGFLPRASTVQGRRDIATWLASTPEAFGLRIQRYSQRLTQTPLGPEELLDVLGRSGRRSWEAAQAVLAAQLRGVNGYASPAQVVDALYETYGTTAQGAGRTYWVDQIGAGRSPLDLANVLRRGAVQRQALVTERYRQILGQTPDAAGLAYWTGRLASEGGEKALVVALMGTERFRQLSLSPS